MEPKTVDARGLACPMPVINTKNALESIREGEVTTIVDNEAARENVLALAKSMGCGVDIRQKENEFHIRITKKDTCQSPGGPAAGNTVLLISASEMGRGSAELGAVLTKSFMFTLFESDVPPSTMLFINSGVNLTCEGSPVLEHLAGLAGRGVEVLSCGTCLDYFKLKEKLKVGQVTNMYTILEKMNNADKVISL